jgi:hypothetical protein
MVVRVALAAALMQPGQVVLVRQARAATAAPLIAQQAAAAAVRPQRAPLEPGRVLVPLAVRAATAKLGTEPPTRAAEAAFLEAIVRPPLRGALAAAGRAATTPPLAQTVERILAAAVVVA